MPKSVLYEYNPENLERGKGFNLSTDGSQGAMLPAKSGLGRLSNG